MLAHRNNDDNVLFRRRESTVRACDRRAVDIADDCIANVDVIGNTEIALDLTQAGELVRLPAMAVGVIERKP
jgi:hypothetical protein